MVTLRELARELEREAKKRARSPKWRAVSRRFLREHPTCEACGDTKAWTIAHHVVPFHVDQSRELDPGNLIALCASGNADHRMLGHGGAFQCHVASVRADAQDMRANPRLRYRIEQRAFVTRQRHRGVDVAVPWLNLAWHALAYVVTAPGLLRAAWGALRGRT